MNGEIAYLQGKWVEANELHVSPEDLGFALGVTVVERLRTFGGQPFELDGHLRRLARSLEIVGWDAERIVAEVRGAISEFIERNSALVTPGDDWAIVAFVTPGRTADAVEPTVCVHGNPLAFAGWAHQFDEGVRLCITDVRQAPGSCWPAELKHRSRMHYYLADREAARRFPGSRALLLDQQGFVGEASTANVVCWSRERGIVVPRQSGVLPGISQGFLFELADELGIARREADIRPEELLAADEVWLASTSVCILPVVQVDDRPIGGGAPGAMYRRLLAAWGERVGVDIAEQARAFAKRGS